MKLEKVNFKNLDFLIRERVFELASPRMKHLSNSMNEDLEVKRCNGLRINKFTEEKYSELIYKEIWSMQWSWYRDERRYSPDDYRLFGDIIVYGRK